MSDFTMRDDITPPDTTDAVEEAVQVIVDAIPLPDDDERKKKFGIFAEADIVNNEALKLITVVLDRPLAGRTVATLTVDTAEAATRIFGALANGLGEAVKKVDATYTL